MLEEIDDPRSRRGLVDEPYTDPRIEPSKPRDPHSGESLSRIAAAVRRAHEAGVPF